MYSQQKQKTVTGISLHAIRKQKRFSCFNTTIKAYLAQWILQLTRYKPGILPMLSRRSYICEMNSHMNRQIGKSMLRNWSVEGFKGLTKSFK